MIRLGVVGVGSFGEKRAEAAARVTKGKLVGVADVSFQRARDVAQRLGVAAFTVEELLANPKIDVVCISVPNKFHAPLAIQALEYGKHVMCEKPLARFAAEAEAIVVKAEECGRVVKTGSNHRYFQSVAESYKVARSGAIGEPVSFNGRIGNNGERLRNAWFWDREMSGGGTLLDNGCHLLDIARWILGDFVEGTGLISNAYWKDCPVEDTATGVFVTSDGKMATIASSWRQLSGYFHFEVNGSHGYIAVDGRFDTHGGDNLYWQSTKSNGEIHSINFGHVKPNSYVDELEDFLCDIEAGREPKPNGHDGLAVLRMVEAIYCGNGKRVILD
jgi:predicted dehydrogenase